MSMIDQLSVNGVTPLQHHGDYLDVEQMTFYPIYQLELKKI